MTIKKKSSDTVKFLEKLAGKLTLASLLTAIEALALISAFTIVPSNIIVLVTVPVSPLVITVPVVAGNVIVFVPATAVGCKVIVPLVPPGNATLLIPVNAWLELELCNAVVPAYMLGKRTNANVPELIFEAFVVSVVAEVANPVILLVVMLPANIVFVTVPVSPVVITVPVTAGKVIVFEPATEGAVNNMIPEVDPAKLKPAPLKIP